MYLSWLRIAAKLKFESDFQLELPSKNKPNLTTIILKSKQWNKYTFRSVDYFNRHFDSRIWRRRCCDLKNSVQK